ncbi:MAG: hypothetical protein HQK70_06865 [Desulfamplus sp.]|nr:hypothetical protein [Desulfamplus sp.]
MAQIKLSICTSFSSHIYYALSVVFISLFLFINLGRCSSDKSETLIINSDMQYSYALKQFQSKDFQTAIVELHRFIHFFPDDKRINDAKFKKGLSLFYTQKYVDASTVFKDLSSPLFDCLANGTSSSSYSASQTISANQTINDKAIKDYSISIEALFMLNRTFLAMKRVASAVMVLQDFLLLNDDPSLEDRTLYTLCLIHIQRAADNKLPYKESMQYLVKSVEYIDKMTPSGRAGYNMDNIKQKILQTTQGIEQKKKSSITAGIASIIPGGGFAYCNRYQDALIAFLLNSAFVLASVESFEDENSALGGLIAFIGSGFYGGSIYGGISSVHKHNKYLIKSGVKSISDEYQDNDYEKSRGHKIPLLSITIPF